MATRLSLRTNARARADQDNSTFPSDVQYNVYLDRAAAAVWRRLVASGWLPDRKTLAVVGDGAVSHPLAADVFSVLSVDFVGPDGRVPLRRAKPEFLPYLLQSVGQATDYALVGGAITTMSIELYPRPSSGNYEVRYIPRFAGFATDGDVWNGPDGTDELIEVGAAMRGVAKENGDVGQLTAEYKEIWGQVLDGAHWLDTPQTVRDTNGTTPGLPFDFNVIPENL